MTIDGLTFEQMRAERDDWHNECKRLIAEEKEQRRRADEATHQWGVIEWLLGAREEERDDLKAEVARLRDVLGNLLAGIEARLIEDEMPVEKLPLYGPSAAWFYDAIRAAQREFTPPFTDATTVSKHAPDVDHTFDLGGLMPLPLSVERIVNDTEPAQTEQD